MGPNMAVGHYGRTWFDTGAMGVTTLYGRVVKAGPATYTIRWESGLSNRVAQGYAGVERVAVDDVDPTALLRLRTDAEREAGR